MKIRKTKYGELLIPASVLDKIRAEIKTMGGDIETIADVLVIIDKYSTRQKVRMRNE